jgi:hypothetical protein
MAKTFEVRSWDDLADPRTVEADKELFIGIDGEWFELDLCEANHKEVMTVLRAWADAGRLAERAPQPPKRPSPRQLAIEYQAGLREFAETRHGLQVGPGDYVPKPVKDEYEAIAGKAPVWRKEDLA